MLNLVYWYIIKGQQKLKIFHGRLKTTIWDLGLKMHLRIIIATSSMKFMHNNIETMNVCCDHSPSPSLF